MKLTLGVALMVLSTAAFAGEPVVLQNLKSQGTNATGTCGEAKVSVSGVGSDFIEFAGRVDIVSGVNKLSLSGEDAAMFFQDFNRVACLTTPKGPMLVAKASCSGSSCIPDDFRVVDTKTAKIVSKGTEEDGCDTACAEKALGMRLPESLRPAYAD